MVVSKSPLTDGWGEANSGGTFGPEMKAAGYDGVFFSGISDGPVYLLIKDGKAVLRDASSMWGKDTHDTDDILHQEIGDEHVKIACVGPAGEAGSALACIVNEKGRVAGRNGLGAVMGSKKLKAIAVKGSGHKTGIADPNGLREARQKFDKLIQANGFGKQLKEGGTAGGFRLLVSIGDSPLKNWRLSGLDVMPTAANFNGANMDRWKLKSYACHACPFQCGAIIQQDQGEFAAPSPMHRPEYESLAGLGSCLMSDNLEAAIKANDLCNRYGIDTISTGGTIGMAMECYENGLITKDETDGIELTWGNSAAVVAMVEKIGRREGFGAVLADGTGKAVERIGRGSEKYAVAIRGKSLPYHDPRMNPALGTVMISDANPAHHGDCKIAGMLDNGASIGNDPALQMPQLPFDAFDKKGAMYALGFSLHQLLNSAGMCALYTVGSAPPPLDELIAAVTGWDFKWAEGLKTGRRILTIRQAFNAREGLSPDKFQMPKRLLEEPLTIGPRANVKIDFETLKKSFFAAVGWDIKTGKPNKETLSDLGLAELTEDLRGVPCRTTDQHQARRN